MLDHSWTYKTDLWCDYNRWILLSYFWLLLLPLIHYLIHFINFILLKLTSCWKTYSPVCWMLFFGKTYFPGPKSWERMRKVCKTVTPAYAVSVKRLSLNFVFYVPSTFMCPFFLRALVRLTCTYLRAHLPMSPWFPCCIVYVPFLLYALVSSIFTCLRVYRPGTWNHKICPHRQKKRGRRTIRNQNIISS